MCGNPDIDEIKELLELIEQHRVHALLMPEDGIRITYCYPKGTVSFTNDMNEIRIKTGDYVSVFSNPLSIQQIKKMIESLK